MKQKDEVEMGDEVKFTPGPWKAEAYNLRMGSLISYGDISKGESVAIALGRLSADEGRANAALIAAAPDLYAALEVMDRVVTELYPGDVEPDEEHAEEYKAVWNAVMKARAALAKAKGKEGV